MNEVKVLKSKARLYKTIINDQLKIEGGTGTTKDIIRYDGAKVPCALDATNKTCRNS